jgi:CBS domain containing-hemolysin-like protein
MVRPSRVTLTAARSSGVKAVQSACIDIALGLLAFALLLALNAFFVSAELALVAVDRDRIDALAEQGSRSARIASRALGHLSLTLSATQLGVTTISLVLGLVAEPTASKLLPDFFGDAGAAVVALLLATVFQMVISELVPKGIAVAKPVEVTLRLALPLRIYAVAFSPIIKVLNRAADATVRRLGVEPREELRSVRTIDELELLIASSGEEGTLDPEAFALLTRTIRFGHKSAADALVSRVDVETISREATVADVADRSIATGYSRFPVVGDSVDDIVGVVHAKDVLRIPTEARARTSVLDIRTDATFVPEGRDLESLLTEMRGGGVQLAVVVDEYGGMAGIVTLEDLVEEIVGDIEDEYDVVPPITSVFGALPSDDLEIEGTLHLDEVEEATGFEVPEGEYETLAGFLLDRLGRIPSVGDQVRYEGWTFEVTEMERRRIASVRVTAP